MFFPSGLSCLPEYFFFGLILEYNRLMAFPWWLIGKDSTCNAGDAKDADSNLGW